MAIANENLGDGFEPGCTFFERRTAFRMGGQVDVDGVRANLLKPGQRPDAEPAFVFAVDDDGHFDFPKNVCFLIVLRLLWRPGRLRWVRFRREDGRFVVLAMSGPSKSECVGH